MRYCWRIHDNRYIIARILYSSSPSQPVVGCLSLVTRAVNRQDRSFYKSEKGARFTEKCEF